MDGLAVLAGLGIGGSLVLYHHAGTEAFFWPLSSGRTVSLIIAVVFAFAGGSGFKPKKSLLPLATLAGALDVGGNAFFLLGSVLGRLDVAAVVSSLYPATTVLLAWIFLKERFTRAQGVGILVILAAIPLIAL